MKVAVLIDGGFTRIMARQAGYLYNPDFIEALAECARADGETLFRALYYDCEPFNGIVKLPVSGNERTFSASGRWLDELAKRDFFAVRRGVLKFRGFKPKKIPIAPRELRDSDFQPDFEQKGVDMRIGLDMASLAANRNVDRIILFSNDTDCVPAMKQVRKSGLQMVVAQLPNQTVASELLLHSDMCRKVVWPNSPERSEIDSGPGQTTP